MESILERGAVDLGYQSARAGECRAVQADPLAD